MTSLAVFALFVLFSLCCQDGSVADADIEILGITSCAPIAPNYELNLDLKEEGGEKALYATYTFPEDLSNDFKVFVRVDQKIGDLWQKDIIVGDGDFCTYLQQYTGNAYLMAAKAAQPEMTEDCPITAGSFTLDHFQISSDDVTLPQVTGHFMVEAKLFDPDEQLITCQKVETIVS